MQVSALNAETRPASTSPTRSTDLDKQVFLQLLVAQLRNQDPLKPLDSREFITQLAQLHTLEQTEALVSASHLALEMETLNQSLALVGRRVEYQSVDGATRSGIVEKVQLSGGLPTLVVDGRLVAPGDVVAVAEA